MQDLTNKTVLITGAARGIGRGMAEAFLQAGANIAAADIGAADPQQSGATDTDWTYALASSEELNTTVAELAGAYPRQKIEAIGVDVSKDASCKSAVEQTVKAFGSIDVLANNAGVVQSGPILEFSEEDWDKVFAVNTRGLFLMTRAALPALKKSTAACVINTASIAGLKGYPNMTAYCGSKFAAIGITQSLAAELAPDNIRVNAICPGMVGTAMWLEHLLPGGAGANNADADFDELMASTIPLGRPQTPQDMGEAAVYLAGASNVTGIALPVAGGFEMS